jgi:hypothetical protein
VRQPRAFPVTPSEALPPAQGLLARRVAAICYERTRWIKERFKRYELYQPLRDRMLAMVFRESIDAHRACRSKRE